MTVLVPDREGLLAALVLAPATFSRNRYFEMYRDPAVRRVRGRAMLVRGIVRHLSAAWASEGAVVGASPIGEELVEVSYEVPALGLRRTSRLEALEAALVRYALWRSGVDIAPLRLDAGDRERIEAALQRLAPDEWAERLHGMAPQGEP